MVKNQFAMRIILLRGPSSCGKTTTLNIVYTLTLDAGGTSTNRQPLGGDPLDFSDIVIYKDIRVAFFTMGDYSGYLVDAMRSYNTHGLDLLICACNDKFVRPFLEIEKYSNNIINKTVAPNIESELAVNTTDANMIFRLF